MTNHPKVGDLLQGAHIIGPSQNFHFQQQNKAELKAADTLAHSLLNKKHKLILKQQNAASTRLQDGYAEKPVYCVKSEDALNVLIVFQG